MTWNAVIKWVMVVSGVLTCTMFYAAVAPHAAMRASFGATLDGPLAEIIVRNWGVLVGLMGAMLLYGAVRPEVRRFVLIVSGTSKAAFIVLVFVFGRPHLANAGPAVAIDLLTIGLFAAYLVTVRERLEPRPGAASVA